MYELRANVRMIHCAFAGWSESAYFRLTGPKWCPYVLCIWCCQILLKALSTWVLFSLRKLFVSFSCRILNALRSFICSANFVLSRISLLSSSYLSSWPSVYACRSLAVAGKEKQYVKLFLIHLWKAVYSKRKEFAPIGSEWEKAVS